MPTPLLETLCDDFNAPALDATTWTHGGLAGTLVQASGVVTVSNEMMTVDQSPAWSLRDSSLAFLTVHHAPTVVGVPNVLNDQDAWQLYLQPVNPVLTASGEASDLYLWFCYGNTTAGVWIDKGPNYGGGVASYYPGLPVTPSNKPDMRWWRISDDPGGIIVEWSPDGITYSLLWQATGVRAPAATGMWPSWTAGTGTTLIVDQVGWCGGYVPWVPPPPPGPTRRFARAYIID